MNELLQVKNLTFHYDEYDNKTGLPYAGRCGVNNISFSIPEGAFVTLCGSTGSGKSTLLKLIKQDVITSGQLNGEILLNGCNIADMPVDKRSSEIGLLFQNPEDQIVTDKVWHELAFGLENLGMSQSSMEARLAESLAFFRLEGISHKDTATLSGGQKQLLSLAGVVAMYPKLLLLDEPTSQLDPEAAEHYLSTLKKLQTSLGLTIIIAEHNLDSLLSISDMLMVMDRGNLVYCDSIANLTQLNNLPNIVPDLPLATRWGLKNNSETLPLDTNSGRSLLKKYITTGSIVPNKENFSDNTRGKANKENFSDNTNSKSNTENTSDKNEPLLRITNICYKYKAASEDVINELSASFNRGTVYAILGCNASGKSTLLNVLTGSLKPQLGHISPKLSRIKLAYMPQDTDNMFISESVEKELLSVGLKPTDYPLYLKNIDFTKSPLDLSGGEKQLLGLAKISARRADLIILDEPTKGTDSRCRKEMVDAIHLISASGTTVIMACHDMDFAAECADMCAIMSMGRLTEFRSSKAFFTDNLLYTTPTRSMTRGIIEAMYREEELFKLSF